MILRVVVGSFIARGSVWLPYGFGEIIDKLTDIERNTKDKHNVTKVGVYTDNESSKNIEKLRKKGVITEEYDDFAKFKAVI